MLCFFRFGGRWTRNSNNVKNVIVILSLSSLLLLLFGVLDSTGGKVRLLGLKRKFCLEGDEPEFALESLKVEDEGIKHYELNGDVEDFTSTSCEIENWNKITTNVIPHSNQHDIWVQENNDRNLLFHSTLSPFAAYVYNTHITVSLTSQTFYKENVTCRYFDCHRNEILPSFRSRVFPQSTVHCGRRPGAEYMAVTINETEEIYDKVVKIEKRITKNIYSKTSTYKHLFTVCLAPLYGAEPKFLQIAEFIEHHKLQGATFFHVYVANISNYDRRVLDDYVKGNEVEIIEMMDYYMRDEFMWQNVQVNDCHHRSKNLAKWTAFIDVDERMEMLKHFATIADYLRNIRNPNVNMLHWQIQWVIKNETSPGKYENDAQIVDNMVFRRFRNTSQIGPLWMNAKTVIRPERYAMMTVHTPKFPYFGYMRTFVEDFGVVKHYRNVGSHDKGIFKFLDDKFQKIMPFYIPEKEPWQNDLLTKNVLDIIRKVYGSPNLTCEQRKSFYQDNRRPFSC